MLILLRFTNLGNKFIVGAVILSLWKALFGRFSLLVWFSRFGLVGLVWWGWFGRLGLQVDFKFE